VNGRGVEPAARFKKARPCPICGGGDDMPRGKGQRCSGYLSADGRFAYCTREEHAGNAQFEDTEPISYRHILEGECRCGLTHGSARTDDPEATYDYTDAAGELVFQVVRKAGKQFPQRRPDGNGGWIWNIRGVQRYLYRLPEVLAAARAGETVYVVEGEKDVHALEAAGVVATTNPGGAGKWRREYAAAFAGASEIVIVADRDERGILHARLIAATLNGVPVRIVQAAEGKDAADHLAAGRTIAELVDLETAAEHERGAGRLRGAVTDDSLSVVTAERFAAVREPGAEPLIGDRTTNLLPEGALVLVYGGEGAGKTTLLLDLAFHLAAGTAWLGLDVPSRRRVLWIENEGPRGLFREKLAAKLAAWGGPTLDGNLSVAEDPWGQFTFANELHRRRLAQTIEEGEIDVLIVGPVQTLGVEGTGTPADVRDFAKLIEQTRGLLSRPLCTILIHHANKTGDVSGAWGPVPDTILHVGAQGNGKTRAHWRKARWASAVHGTAMQLRWREGECFDLDERPDVTEDTIETDLLAAVQANPGGSWTTIRNADGVRGGAKELAKVRDRLLSTGAIVNTATRKGAFNLWTQDDPELPFPDGNGRTNGGTEAARSPRTGSAEFRSFRSPSVEGTVT
jgi:5S rRNA maturation endonuclease (ribonuclease M5)